MLSGSKKYQVPSRGTQEKRANGGQCEAGQGSLSWSETQARWGDEPPQSWRPMVQPQSMILFLSISKRFIQEQQYLCALIYFFCRQSPQI